MSIYIGDKLIQNGEGITETIYVNQNVSMPSKTGQTTQHGAINSDGYYQRGSGVSHSELKHRNRFLNYDRFTDTLGGQSYANDWVIDWSKTDGDKVLAYFRIPQTNAPSGINTLKGAANSAPMTIGGYPEAKVCNIIELHNITKATPGFHPFNYPPFNIPKSVHIMSSTTGEYADKYQTYTGGGTINRVAASTVTDSGAYRWLPMRYFTMAELGLPVLPISLPISYNRQRVSQEHIIYDNNGSCGALFKAGYYQDSTIGIAPKQGIDRFTLHVKTSNVWGHLGIYCSTNGGYAKADGKWYNKNGALSTKELEVTDNLIWNHYDGTISLSEPIDNNLYQMEPAMSEAITTTYAEQNGWSCPTAEWTTNNADFTFTTFDELYWHNHIYNNWSTGFWTNMKGQTTTFRGYSGNTTIVSTITNNWKSVERSLMLVKPFF